MRTVSDDGDESRSFGARVRGLREHKLLTLAKLSEVSGVSRAMLSKVERGEKSPTIGIAKRIAHALDTSLSYLSGGEEHRRTATVVRRAERHVFRDDETGMERHLLSPVIAGSDVELVCHHLPAKVSTGVLPPYPAATEKLVVVTEGAVVASVQGAEFALSEGDTLYFEADVEHGFENRGETPSVYYLFISRCDR